MRKIGLLIWLLSLLALAQQVPWPAWTRLLEAVQAHEMELALGDPRQERVDKIGATLLARTNPKPPWKFVVVASDKADAGCCGEGAVYLTTALLDLKMDDHELAGILGHEVAHGILHHVETNQQPGQDMQQARLDQQRALEQVADLEEERDQLDPAEFERRKNELGARAVELKHRIANIQAAARRVESQLSAQESDADAVGLQLARLAGYQEDGLLRALDKLHEAGAAPNHLSGYHHQPIPQRLARLRQLLQILPRLNRPSLVHSDQTEVLHQSIYPIRSSSTRLQP